MRIVSGIINILIGLFVLGVAFTALSSYFGGTEAKIAEIQALMDQGKDVVGIVDSVYSETTVAGVTLYSSKYFFKIEEKEYSNTFFFDDPEELLPIVNVKYMPDDPNVNDVDLEKKLAKAQEESNSKFSLYFLWLGLPFGEC